MSASPAVVSAAAALPSGLAALWQSYGTRVMVVSTVFALLTCSAMRARIRASAVLAPAVVASRSGRQPQVTATTGQDEQAKALASGVFGPTILRFGGLLALYLLRAHLRTHPAASPRRTPATGLEAWLPANLDARLAVTHDRGLVVLVVAWGLLALGWWGLTRPVGPGPTTRLVTVAVAGGQLPGTLLLYLVVTGAVWGTAGLLRGSRTHRRRDAAAASLADLRVACRLAASGDLRQARLKRVTALARLQLEATPVELSRHLPELIAVLPSVMNDLPDDVAAVLDRASRDRSGDLPGAVVGSLLAAWVAGADGSRFEGTWDTAERLVLRVSTAGLPDPLRPSLEDQLAALLSVPGGVTPNQTFRRATVARALLRLDSVSVGQAARRRATGQDPLSAYWTLLTLLGPPDGPSAPAGWACVLGDRAWQRHDHDAARARYRLGVDGGCPAALPRLAHVLAVEGYELGGQGRFEAAHTLLDQAVGLHDRSEYRLLRDALGVLVGGQTRVRSRAELESRRTDPATADGVRLWLGLADLLDGRRDDAERELSVLRLGGSLEAVTACLLQDEARAAQVAWQLLQDHGVGWTAHTPVGVEALVVAAARRPPRLLEQLLAPADVRAQLSTGAAEFVADTLLRRCLSGAESTGATRHRIDLVERLLVPATHRGVGG